MFSIRFFLPCFATIYAVPKTELIGDTNRYVKEGSKVSLHCVVTGAIDPPLYIIWYHSSQQVFPDNRRGWRTDIIRNSPESESSGHSTVSEFNFSCCFFYIFVEIKLESIFRLVL